MGGRSLDAPEWQALLRAQLLLLRFSTEMTAFFDGFFGDGVAGNHEFQILSHLARNGSAGPGDLAEVTGLSRAAVGRVVSHLEDAGLVERRPSPTDRRAVLVSLTTSGRRRVTRMQRELGLQFRSLAPLVKEIVDLLGQADELPIVPDPDGSPLVAAHELSEAGSDWQNSYETVLERGRPRLAATAIALWGEARPGQLQDLLDLSSGGVTYLVDHLVALGVVRREYGTISDDRRGVSIRLTPAGEREVRTIALALQANAEPLSRALVATVGSSAVF